MEQAGDEPGHLPLLEFVLRRLWEDRLGGLLHHEAYKAMGQLEGAMAKKAESLYANLTEDDQRRVQQIFLRLIRPGDGEADTRRRATLVEVGEEFRGLADRLADERLLVTSRLAGTAEETVEVSHEALIRHWQRLKGWVEADRRFLAWQQRLTASIEQYEKSDGRSDFLLRGFPLTEALEWLKKKPGSFSPRERRFVMAGKERQSNQRFVAGIVTVLVVWLILLMASLWQRGYSLHQAVLWVQSTVWNIYIEPDMQVVSAGTFRQGDTYGLGDRTESPVHDVAVKKFAMGKFEVTFEEYDRYAIAMERPLPSDQGWGRDRRPVINVSWEDARDYAAWLSQQTGKRYRLPTESEWEYAARSEGKDGVWAGTSDAVLLGLYAVHSSRDGTMPVGERWTKPNMIGLHDMSGNVWEWVNDCWHDNYKGAPQDGSVWLQADGESRNMHVIRGGAWYDRPEKLRVSFRYGFLAHYRGYDVGFPLVQDLP